MLLEEVYERLKSENLCVSGYDFSQNFLGKTKSYYSVLKARNAQPSVDALVMLEISLKEKAKIYENGSYEFYGRLRNSLESLSSEVRQYRYRVCYKRVRENQYGVVT